MTTVARRSHLKIPVDYSLPVFEAQASGGKMKVHRVHHEGFFKRIEHDFESFWHHLVGDFQALKKYDNAETAIADLKNSGDVWNFQMGAAVSIGLGGRADFGISVTKEDDGYSIVRQGDAGPVETLSLGPVWLEASEVFERQATYHAADAEDAKKLAHALMHSEVDGVTDVKQFVEDHRTQVSYIGQFTGTGSAGPTLPGLPDPLAQLLGADLSLTAQVQATVQVDLPKSGPAALTLSGNGSFDVNGTAGLFPDSAGTPWLHVISSDVNGAVNLSRTWQVDSEKVGTLKTLEELAAEALKKPATSHDDSLNLTVSGGALGKLHAVEATIDLSNDKDAKAHIIQALRAARTGELGNALEALGSTPLSLAVQETRTFGIDLSQQVDIPVISLVVEPTLQADKVETVGGFPAKEMTGSDALASLKAAISHAVIRHRVSGANM